jgi:hypothetical protein
LARVSELRPRDDRGKAQSSHYIPI